MSSTTDVILDGGPLSIAQVAAVARHGEPVSISATALERMNAGRKVVEEAVSRGDTVYGITTGFGALADVRIPDAELDEMQVALLRSHAAGVGPALDEEIVRAMMLLRSRTLTTGFSGVRPLVVERLVELLNKKYHPVVPEHGSVGASGDLAQLAHLALPLIGEGSVMHSGQETSGAEALASLGLQPLHLSFKEGLALLNGTEAMLAVGCLAMVDALDLAVSADIICAMTTEALLGTDRAFDARLHAIRPHPGQQLSAQNLEALLKGSGILASHRDLPHAVQDAYSIRCAPQVHGACRDVMAFAQGVFERELSSVTDNPVVLTDSEEILSTGNFHGEPLGFALDFLAASLSELGSISERRTDRLLDPDHSSGLPPFLTTRAGTNSGMMLVQYTQASLVVENRILSHPATVDTIPTSGSQEDHVSMGWNAALKLRRVLANVRRILAIELMCAAQGLDLRAPLEGAPGTRAALTAVREVVDYLDTDRVLGPEIEAIGSRLLTDGVLVSRVRNVVELT